MHTTFSPDRSRAWPNTLDGITRRWWFLLILVILFFIPAYASKTYDPRETPRVVIEVLSHAQVYSIPALFPLFKLLPVLLIAWVAAGSLYGSARGSRPLLVYAGLSLLGMAVFQNMAYTPGYGFVVLAGNLLVFTLVGLVWLWSAARGDELVFCRVAAWRYWVVPLALLAFWFPANTALPTPAPEFSLRTLLSNEAGLTLCMMLPVYLALLTLLYPNVNPVVLRVTAFAGLFTGLLNAAEFFANASYGWWLGILHLPLLLISVYAVMLGRRSASPAASPTARD